VYFDHVLVEVMLLATTPPILRGDLIG
jgi:hypothetical protein